MKVRLCDKCSAPARFHVESLDLAFCAHDWKKVEDNMMGRHGRSQRVVDYKDRPIPDHEPVAANA